MCQIKSVQLIPVGYRVIRIILLKFSCPIDKRGDDGKEKRTAPKKIILNWSLIIEFEWTWFCDNFVMFRIMVGKKN